MKFIDASGVEFACPVTFSGGTTPAIELAGVTDITLAGELAAATVATSSTVTATGNITSSATVTGADVVSTDDMVCGDDLTVTGAASIGETLTVTGATTCAALTASGTVTTSGTLDINGNFDFAGAGTITPKAGYHFVRSYTSQTITQTDLTAGASCTVALTGEPTGWIPIAVSVETTAAVTSSTGDTTGLTVKLGISGTDDGYLGSVSIFGAAGAKEVVAGSLVPSYRASDALIATFTATGGAPDCADIDALSVEFTVYYLLPA